MGYLPENLLGLRFKGDSPGKRLRRTRTLYPNLWVKNVAHTWFGKNIPGLRGLDFDFQPELPHVHSQVISFLTVFRPPDRLQQSTMGQYLTGMQHQLP